jgi:methionyl-tRNA formyltransferase
VPDISKRIVFMGSPDFAVASLDALCAAARYRPHLVVSQPDRPRGRGRTLSPTPVRARALALGIPTLTMEKATYEDGVREVAAARPDAIVVVAFGLILRRDLLELPPHGCINVHASLLPRHRGVSPIQAAILAGDAITGCTTMRIDEGVDTGDILLQETVPVKQDDTAGALASRLAALGAGLLIRTLDGVFAGTVRATAQDASRATLTRKIRKHHGAIDWARPSRELERHVRAMTPWPSAFTFHRGRRVLVVSCASTDARAPAEPGRVTALEPLTVACGEGALVLNALCPEGGRTMTAAEYLAGHPLVAGEALGPSAAR